MATYSIEDLKRINTCSVLFENKWDFKNKEAKVLPSYLYGIKEIFRWYYRRGSQISPEAIATSVANHAFQSGISYQTKNNLELSIRQYAGSLIYKTMDQPFYNKEIDMIINSSGDLLELKIPAMSMVEKTLYIFSFDLGFLDEDLFLSRYETIAIAYWSFFSLNKTPVFVNLSFDGEKIVEQKIKINDNYIKNITEKISKIVKGIKNNKVLPPSEVCEGCSRRKECPNLKIKNYLQKR